VSRTLFVFYRCVPIFEMVEPLKNLHKGYGPFSKGT
jgi:hypothetical protein